MRTPLTEEVLTYQKLLASTDSSAQRKRERLFAHLRDECNLIIYRYPVTIRVLEEDEAGELLIAVSPRIPRIIANFTYQDLSFEKYMRKIAFLQAHSFLQRKKMRTRRFACETISPEDIEWMAVSNGAHWDRRYQDVLEGSLACDQSYGDMQDLDWTSDTDAGLKVKSRMEKSERFRRRMLQLVLLCSDHLSAAHIAFLAGYMDMDELELARMVMQAIETSRHRLDLTQQTQSVRDYHYFEKMFLEREVSMLKAYNADDLRIQRIEQRLERERRYYRDRCNELACRPCSVTHATVANLTGAPKGTVDSGMQALRKFIVKAVDGET